MWQAFRKYTIIAMIADVHSCHGKVQQLTHCHMEGPLPSLNLGSRPNREIEPA
jgi:N-formylglutamate amidohydrolase